MKIDDVNITSTTKSADRVKTAIIRLSDAVDESLKDFTSNHIERFSELQTAGGTFLILSALAKNAINVFKITRQLTAIESLTIHVAVQSMASNTPPEIALAGLSRKESLIAQSILLAYQIGNLPEAIWAIPAGFEVILNPDNSVTTADFPVVEPKIEEEE